LLISAYIFSIVFRHSGCGKTSEPYSCHPIGTYHNGHLGAAQAPLAA
jgi:hypothetical protein